MQELNFFVPSLNIGTSGLKSLYGMNEIISANRKDKNAGARQKRDEERRIAIYAKNAMRSQRWKTPDVPVTIELVWHEANCRRDFDNISAYQKYLLDGMVKAGVIHDDSQKYIADFPHETLVIDKHTPGVRVTVKTIQ